MNATRAVLVATVGLFVAATVASVAAVVAVRSDRKSTGADVPPASPSPSANPTTPSTGPSASLVDSCLVGLWEIAEETSYFAVDNTTTVKLTLQRGSVNRVNYGADGSGSGTFSVVMAGQSGKYKVEETLEGESSFTFKTDKGVISRVGQYRNSKYVYKINGKASSPVPLTSFPDAVNYTCNGDTLLLHQDDTFDRRYRRIAHG
jgi:hypothetical protein